MNSVIHIKSAIQYLLFSTIVFALPATGAVDMFLKIDGIAGESMDDAHKDEIDVLSWSWGMTQSGTTHTGTTGGTGKVSVQDLELTKYVDKSSPSLMLNCANGRHVSEAILTVRKAGGENPVEFLVITLTEVLVSSVSIDANSADDRLTENVTLNFAKVNVEYTATDPTGKPSGSTIMSWDIPLNKEG